MRSYLVHGVVINRLNVGEADRIITLFTKESGKLTFKAKGIRKITSRRAGSLELFNLVKVSAVPTRGQMDVLTEVSVIETFSHWRGFLGRVTLAYQFCETIDKLTAANQPFPDVFSLLVSVLSHLGDLGDNWQTEYDSWLIQLVKDLGFWPADKPFNTDIHSFIENLSERPINSRQLLKKLKR